MTAIVVEDQKIITRQEALEKEVSRYFTGIPCKYGHIAERLTCNSLCLQCSRDRSKTEKEKTRVREKERKKNKTIVRTHCEFCGEILQRVNTNARADCKRCVNRCNERNNLRKWVQRNQDKVIARRRKENSRTSSRIFARIKSRAKTSGLPFNLEISDIVLPSICPVLGIPISDGTGVGKRNRPDSYSVDRIYPEKGYVKGNIRIISNRANLLKSNAEVWELEAVLKDLKQIRGVL